MNDFKPGDQVATPYEREYTVLFGPYVDAVTNTYLVKDSDGATHQLGANILSPKPVDPRRDIVRDAMESFPEWHSPDSPHEVYGRVADAILAALDTMNGETR